MKSLHGFLHGRLWIMCHGMPKLVVRPLDENQRPSQLHGWGPPWLVCEVVLSLPCSWTPFSKLDVKVFKYGWRQQLREYATEAFAFNWLPGELSLGHVYTKVTRSWLLRIFEFSLVESVTDPRFTFTSGQFWTTSHDIINGWKIFMKSHTVSMDNIAPDCRRVFHDNSWR